MPFYFNPMLSTLAGLKRRKLKTVILVYLGLVAFSLAVNWGDIFIFFLRLFNKEDYGFSYWDPERFRFIGRAFEENPQFPVIIAAWIILMVWHRSILSRASQTTGLFILLTLVLFPDKLPFWVSTQILLFFFVVSDDFKTSKWLYRTTLLMTLFSVVNGVYWVRQLELFSNERQLSLIHQTENLLKASPDAKVYDGLGLFPYSTSNGLTVSSVFFGPGQAQANLEFVERLRHESFDIFVVTHKLSMYEFALRDDFHWHYIELPGGVFIRAVNIHIQNPKQPGEEIVAGLGRLVERRLTDSTRIAILLTTSMPPRLLSKSSSGNQQELFSPSELPDLPSLCESCRDATVAIIPTGQFLTARFRWSFDDEFAFEPRSEWAPRESLLRKIHF